MAVTPPLIALKDARLAFGATTLFSGLDLTLASGERACLVGRNGTGKSSLLKILAGLQDLDGGERFLQPGTRVAYLPQDPQFDSDETIADYVTRDPNREGGGGGDDAPRHAVEAVLVRLQLDGTRKLGGLSGGEGRRVALARCLVSDPEVLLLDEPTNHLDLPTIDWLEGELKRFRGALLVISHDRTFLAHLTNTTLWLDRGKLLRLDKSFAFFDDWAEELRQQEAETQHKLERQIVREERWLQRGVTARRKRNQGRLARLQALQAVQAAVEEGGEAGAGLADRPVEQGVVAARGDVCRRGLRSCGFAGGAGQPGLDLRAREQQLAGDPAAGNAAGGRQVVNLALLHAQQLGDLARGQKGGLGTFGGHALFLRRCTATAKAPSLRASLSFRPRLPARLRRSAPASSTGRPRKAGCRARWRKSRTGG